MKSLLTILITHLILSSGYGQVTRTNIAWHSNVKEIHYKINKHNIERTEFDRQGRKTIDIEYHPVTHPLDGIGHGYDSTIYEYHKGLEITFRYFNWYEQTYLEEQIYQYKLDDYDSIMSIDKNGSVNSIQIKSFIQTDTLEGNVNDKGFAVDTFYYYKQDNRIVRHYVVWNQKNGNTIHYTNNIEYNSSGKVIYERDSFNTSTKYIYNRKGYLKLLIHRKPNPEKVNQFIKEKVQVSYVYF